jgi:O-antigen/teichoic acid export membrane protein
MKAKTARSFAFTTLEQYASIAIGLASSVVIARLLTPEQIGLYSLAGALIAFANLVRDFGVSQYIVYVEDLSNARLRAALCAQLCASWTLAIVLVLCAYPYASFLGQPQLSTILHVLAFNFVILPFGAVTLSVLRREMRFGAIFVMSIAVSIVSALASIGLAVLDFGVWALVYGSIATAVATVVGAAIMRPTGMPWVPSFRGVKEVAKFGGTAGLANVVSEVGGSGTEVIIGRALGPAELAQYGKAAVIGGLFNRFVMGIVWRVTYPLFAQARRDGSDVSSMFVKAVSLLTCIAWPALLLAGIEAHNLIPLLFGPQWTPAILPAQVLAISGCISAATSLSGPIATSVGLVGSTLRLSSVHTLALLILVTLSAPAGLLAVSLAVLASAVVQAAAFLHLLHQKFEIGPIRMLRSLVPSCAVTALTIVPVALAHMHPAFGQLPPLASIALSSAFAALLWVASIRAMQHPISAEVRAATLAIKKAFQARA